MSILEKSSIELYLTDSTLAQLYTLWRSRCLYQEYTQGFLRGLLEAIPITEIGLDAKDELELLELIWDLN